MKNVYFKILDFEGKIPNKDSFDDYGYFDKLVDGLRISLKNLGRPSSNDYIKQNGLADIFNENNSGCHYRNINLEGARASRIFYLNISDKSKDIFNRAHEETHATCFLGLRSELEKKIGISGLNNLYEEDFCDQVGLYVLRQKDINPHPDLLIPHAERLIMMGGQML